MMKKSIQSLFLTACTFVLTSCGGSSDETVADPPQANWQPGIYADASVYKNFCEAPRTGSDANGNGYADKAGSSDHEKLWLRSWSNHTYLWYNEIIDQDIAGYNSPESYFSILKTTAQTASGSPRDQFHYTQDTEEYTRLTSSSGVSASYGTLFKVINRFPPRDIRIMYTEPGSPASSVGLSRGAEILSVDGVSVVDGDHIVLNNGLFPEDNGETHTFTVRDLGASTSRIITMTAGTITINPVHNTRVIDTPTGRVGYLTFNTFATRSAESALATAMGSLANQNIDDLVIDLRYNGGGYLAISAQLAYMVAGAGQSAGKTFDKLVFNNKHPNTNPVTGASIQPMTFLSNTIGFSTIQGQALPALNLNRVYVLTTNSTCSASEAFINGLRGIDIDVVLIGNTTCGKPYGFYSTDNCGTTYSTIQFRGENDKDFGDYADGFSPANTTDDASQLLSGCRVDDDLLHVLGDEQEAMLSAALEHRNSNSCPPVPASRPSESGDPALDLLNDPRIIERKLKERIILDGMRATH